jgi:hypothetical protein
MKAICRNILCKGKPFEIEFSGNKKELNDIQCPHCNHIGVMFENQIANSDEIMRQVLSWRLRVLYRDAFKVINYKKLPATMEQQSVSETKEMRPIPNWEDQTKKQRKIIGYKKRM